MNRHWPILVAAVWALVGSTGYAQIDLNRFQRQLEQIQRETRMLVDPQVPADQRALLDYGGFVTFNFLAVDDVLQETSILRQTDLNGYLRVNLDGVHEFFLRARTSYIDFNTGDSFDAHGDDLVEPTLDRGHYRFDLQRYAAAYEGKSIPYNVIVQGGRQLVHWANGLTLSEEIDGGLVQLSYEPVTLDILAGMKRDSSPDIDSSRPDFTDDTDRQFYGGMLSVQVDPRHRPFVYGIVQRDGNSDVLTTGGVTTQFDYDSHYVGFGSTGSFGDNLIYGAEFVYQGGDGLSNSFDPGTGAGVVQTDEQIEALAMDLRLDYLLNDGNRTRFSGELIVASGDTDRVHTTDTFGGNATGTDDHAFNAFGLIDTGLAFNPNVSNLLLVRLGGSTFPLPTIECFRRLQVGVNFFVFNKLNRNAPIDETTNTKTFLGWESDLYMNWQLTSDLSWAVRYGVFLPGDAIAVDHDARHFVFSGVTIAF